MEKDLIISLRKEGGALYHCKVIFVPAQKFIRLGNKVNYWSVNKESVFEGTLKNINEDGSCELIKVTDTFATDRKVIIHKSQICELVEVQP